MKKLKHINISLISIVVLLIATSCNDSIDPMSETLIDTEFSVNGVLFDMVAVEGGTFTMGATSEQGSDARYDELPTHQVTLSDFMIGKTEVTQELWEAVMGNNPSYFKGDDKPVMVNAWYDCQQFLNKLNSLTSNSRPKGMVFRLPTEAEWEYAARGGNKSKGYKYSGSEVPISVAWCSVSDNVGPQPVATKSPNELGIYDMSGNVREWCSDWYGEYGSDSQIDPIGPLEGDFHVIRGGYVGSDLSSCRVSSRSFSNIDSGLRLVLAKGEESETFDYETYLVNGISFDMVAVVGGTFTMGATLEQDSTSESDERPAHQVTLSDYMIGKTEVTVEMWCAVMGINLSEKYNKIEPMDNVSWNECQQFIRRLNWLTSNTRPKGMVFRLPTEAEWEYAARGGNQSKGYKYSGSNNIGSVAWYKENRYSSPFSVATIAPNELGIYDMSGNVWEWCSDWYGSYNGNSQINPQGPSDGSDRVIRGGSSNSGSEDCRVSNRDKSLPDCECAKLGLRIVLADGEESDEYQTYVVNGVMFDMVFVKGGTFTMGATSEQGSKAPDDESPAHQVTLSDFMIASTEVTQKLWKAVMASDPSLNKGTSYPMINISWDECQIFIKRLNLLTGLNFRLPTEAEWEYAARGGIKSKGNMFSGSNDIDKVAWYNDYNESKHAVAIKAPNELGLYDMSGNVREWCSDWYGDYDGDSQTNPKGPLKGNSRVCRGGSWKSKYENDCRVSRRAYAEPNYRSDFQGFRLVLSVGVEYDEIESLNKPNFEYETYTINGVSFDMVAVEGGTFTMGATSEQGGDAWDNEKPAHNVTLSDYMIAKTEVTQGLWIAVMGTNPSYFKGYDLPVESVSWDDCQEFIKKLNSITGFNFRLPTEAEWEYAARGGNKSKGYKYSGSDNLGSVAWYSENSGISILDEDNWVLDIEKTNKNQTHIVAIKLPNELGIYDMSGNVDEWCSDYWWGSYSSDSQIDPKGPSSGYYRLRRGGSWYEYSRKCRVSYRNYYRHDDKCDYLGLRLAL